MDNTGWVPKGTTEGTKLYIKENRYGHNWKSTMVDTWIPGDTQLFVCACGVSWNAAKDPEPQHCRNTAEP